MTYRLETGNGSHGGKLGLSLGICDNMRLLISHLISAGLFEEICSEIYLKNFKSDGDGERAYEGQLSSFIIFCNINEH